MKKILVIYYSQSGQLDEIMENFLVPFNKSQVDLIKISLENPFPWPWTVKTFFDCMPETVLEEPCVLEPISFATLDYDMIVLGYQPWYLSPSIPTTALFSNEEFLSLLKGKPVITIIGARNMWLNSQEIIKERIHRVGGILVANVPFIDHHNNFISAYSILQWMITGVKKRYHGIFPRPGVSEQDIIEANVFGEIVWNAFEKRTFDDLQQKLLATGKINIGTDILFIELKAKKIFFKFANLIKKKGTTPERRARYVRLFKYYLVIALFFVAPIVFLLYTITLRPIMLRSNKRKKQYFCGIQRKVKQDE